MGEFEHKRYFGHLRWASLADELDYWVLYQRNLEALAAERRKHDRRCGAFDGPPTYVEQP